MWPFFARYLIDAMNKANETERQRRTLFGDIIRRESSSEFWFKVFILVNSVGLLLGLIGNGFETE